MTGLYDMSANEIICIDPKYSTTRCLIKQTSSSENNFSESRCRGGLRLRGYRKKSLPGKSLVTVITVVFNGAKFLEETINSVLNQTYDNVEYIIIDGASTDGTQAIIERYEHIIDYWISEKDAGIYDAMNKGIDAATGDWINFINAGDSFYNKNVLMLFSGKNYFCDVLYGNTQVVYEHGNTKIVDASSVVKFFYGPPFNHQSCFVRAELHKIKKFDLRYKICSDFHTFVSFYKNGNKFEYVNSTISTYALNGQSSVISVKTLYELYSIGGLIHGRFLNVFFFSAYLFARIIKELLKKLLPRNIVRKIQDRNF
ncbi:MAG: glycosyltransferase [Erysipelotrichia bacterium]|nr:glycosyltransferase [Erysipelotrichia bacterium]